MAAEFSVQHSLLFASWHRSCPGNANPRGPAHTGYNGYNECVFMAYIPGCSADVFISYAHRDNLDGWVSKLKDKLVEKLTPFLAGRAEVWFDDRIRPGVYLKDEIQQKLKDTPIFVAVVSPSYLDSEFSILHELDWFQNHGGGEIIQLLKVPLEKGQGVPLPTSAYEVLHDPKDLVINLQIVNIYSGHWRLFRAPANLCQAVS